MSKKKTKKKRFVKKTEPEISIDKKKPKILKEKIPILNNLLWVVVFAAAIYWMKNNNTGYKWMTDSLIGANLETIEKYNDISFREKQVAKLGFNATYLHYLVDNTPEDAIILLPPKNVAFSEGTQTNFDKHIMNKTWVTYIVYPRKIVYEDEKETSNLYSKISHVGIINGWGYQKLTYQVATTAEITVLPINSL